MKLDFIDRFSKNTQISNFKEIRPLGTELFHAEGRTDRQTDRQKDRHDGANSRFGKFANATENT